jgi:hypothetical protein
MQKTANGMQHVSLVGTRDPLLSAVSTAAKHPIRSRPAAGHLELQAAFCSSDNLLLLLLFARLSACRCCWGPRRLLWGLKALPAAATFGVLLCPLTESTQTLSS